jgi:CDP-6-deoxy-D-xylo-4-hexulose-3-dehydrase
MEERKNKEAEHIKSEIIKLVKKYYDTVHKPIQLKKFAPGKDKINYASIIYDEKEIINLVNIALDAQFAAGAVAHEFEKKLAEFLGVKYCLLTNSGSSANLLAISALTSTKLKDRCLKPGDEVITTACSFPTTVTPIIQNNLVPVFVDIDISTCNIKADMIEEAISERTKAIFVAHTLGNPCEINKIMKICVENDLFFIEDNCDALGSRYNGRYTGTFGHISTLSFYPAHHITTGEGGAVFTNSWELKSIIKSYRDWGRDCWCDPGQDNSCGKRFDWNLGELPYGYDHKYIYSHFGYNLKATEMQAAIGLAQIEKLPFIIEARKRNWQALREGLSDLSDFFSFQDPTPGSDPAWFGFLIIVKENVGFTRNEIVEYLEKKNIQTRMLFAGNILRQPCFDELRRKKEGYRIVGDLLNTDIIMKNGFWIGVHPGMKKEMIEYIVESIHEFCKKYD